MIDLLIWVPLPAPENGLKCTKVLLRCSLSQTLTRRGLAQIGPDRVEEKIPQQAIGAGSRDGA